MRDTRRCADPDCDTGRRVFLPLAWCPYRDHRGVISGRTPDSNSKGISAVAHHRHKREPNARRLVALTGSRAARIAAGAALATTLPAVALGVLAADPAARPSLVAEQGPAIVLDPARYDRQPVSRSFD